MSIFDRPIAELSDDELNIALAVLAQRREELVALTKLVADLTVGAAAERDRRLALARQVDEAIAEAAGVSALAEPRTPDLP